MLENDHEKSTTTTSLPLYNGQVVQHEEVSCGILLFKIHDSDTKTYDFLLMKHSNRLDLPKGRMEPGETFLETAKREFWEETSIDLNLIRMHSTFEFVEQYSYFSHRKKMQVGKTLRMYIAFVKDESTQVKVVTTEHGSHNWKLFTEKRPFSIQKNTIDPLLKSIQNYLNEKSYTLHDLYLQSQ